MHPARRTVILFLSSLSLGACSESIAPTPVKPALGNEASAAGAVREHLEFDHANNFDIALSCLNGEMTHWEGTVRVTMDIVTTPSGLVQEQVQVTFQDGYFVQRANGVKYYPIGPFNVNEHHLFGPITVIAGTAAGAWRSNNGDVLALGFHVQFVYDANGTPVLEKLTGACP